MKRNHEKSTGNVFADLGFPHAEQELAKAKLTAQIYRLLKDRGLPQAEAAKLLGTTQSQASALMHCRPVSVSIGRLIDFLTILGQDVEVTVKPASRPKNYELRLAAEKIGEALNKIPRHKVKTKVQSELHA
jgi:predicted XRE-type DNA-binding protein